MQGSARRFFAAHDGFGSMLLKNSATNTERARIESRQMVV
jgi:hypothetical protein